MGETESNTVTRIISFYTTGSRYVDSIKGLEKSCIDLGLPYDFRAYTSRGSWVENCAIKPEFILLMIDKYPNDVLVWIDADGHLFKNYDFAKLVTKQPLCVRYEEDGRLRNGTIILTAKAKPIIQAWANKQKLNPRSRDEEVLQATILEGKFAYELMPAELLSRTGIRPDTVICHARHSYLVPDAEVRVSDVGDGVTLDKPNRNLQHKFNSYMTRVDELRWRAKLPTDVNLIDLLPFIHDKDVTILRTAQSKCPDGPVICMSPDVYAAMKKVAPASKGDLFGFQVDECLRDAYAMVDKKVRMICGSRAYPFYHKAKPYVFWYCDYDFHGVRPYTKWVETIISEFGPRSITVL